MIGILCNYNLTLLVIVLFAYTYNLYLDNEKIHLLWSTSVFSGLCRTVLLVCQRENYVSFNEASTLLTVVIIFQRVRRVQIF